MPRAASGYPLSPRLKPLKSALAKPDPGSVPKPLPQRKPLPEAAMRSRAAASECVGSG
jgi:hypothetical protein